MAKAKPAKAALESLGGQIKDLLVEEGREFLKELRAEDEEFLRQIAFDIAAQQIAASTGTPARRRIAAENLESLRNTARSRLATSSLRFAPKGEELFGKVLGVVIRTAVATAIAL